MTPRDAETSRFERVSAGLLALALERTGGPFSYRLALTGHEFVCRSCGEGARGGSFDAVARWRDAHVCGARA